VDMVSRVGLTPNSQDPNRVLLKANPVWDFGRAAFLGIWGPLPRDRLSVAAGGAGCPWGGGGGCMREALVSFRGRGPAGLGG
jgi:hypothetical protein